MSRFLWGTVIALTLTGLAKWQVPSVQRILGQLLNVSALWANESDAQLDLELGNKE